MPGGPSTYLGNKLLDHVLGGGDYARPATVYVGLLTTLPAVGGSGLVEASTGGYTRISKTNNSTNFPAASSRVKRNGTSIDWPAFTADMPEFKGAGVWDADSGGNLLLWGPFTTPHTVYENETFSIPANGGTFTFPAEE
jgi:hypothetical protein